MEEILDFLFTGIYRFFFSFIGGIFKYFGTGILWISCFGKYSFKDLLQAWYTIPLGMICAFFLTLVCISIWA